MYYVFDGSYNGFLTCVFESFERKEFDVIPVLKTDAQSDLFQMNRTIISDSKKSKRVITGLNIRLNNNKTSDFFRAFLSEDRRAWLTAFNVIQKVFKSGPAILDNYGDEDVLYLTQQLKKVSRESHRMKAFVRFQKSSDDLYVAVVEPDFNVLPLISGFFKKRYADQCWLIYDAKRKYGLLYDGHSVSEVGLSAQESQGLATPNIAIHLDGRDEQFQTLWKQYYKSTNIESRRNRKLHLQHVPKRYWKCLTEKQ